MRAGKQGIFGLATGLLLLFLGYHLGLTTWFSKPGTPLTPAMKSVTTRVKVITTPVKFVANDRIFEVIGTGRARFSVDLYPHAAGEVTEVEFNAGQQVKKGQRLLQLDNREEKLALRLAEVELDKARSLLGRYEQAVQDGAVPESEVDAARADVDAAEVAREQARVALDNREIRAPFSGVVGIPQVEPGDRISTSTLVSGLDNREQLLVEFEIPEPLAGLLQDDNAAAFRLTASTPAYAHEAFPARITAQQNRLHALRRTLLVRAGIDNREDRLRPGMSFRIRWEIPGRDHPTVPEIALQWGHGGSFVWVVREDRAHRVPARVIARSAGQVLLEAEIKAGEQVVTEGIQRLSPAVHVNIVSDG